MYEDVKEKNRIAIEQYELGSDDGRVSFYPRYIQLEHTNRCNARCIMCNHFYLDNRGGKDIDESIIRKLEPILPYCEIMMLNGDGEPFLCHGIEEYIKLYKKYEILVSTNTNLCSFSSLDWEKYKGCFAYLNISCDGATKETFELIRKGLFFQKFINNLDAINEIEPELRKNMDFVIMKENVLELDKVIEFAAEHHFASVHFNMLGTSPIIGNEADAVDDIKDLVAYNLRKAFALAKEKNIQIVLPDNMSLDYDKAKILPQLQKVSGHDYEDILFEREIKARERGANASLSDDHLHIQAKEMDGFFDADDYCSWALERCYIDLYGNVTTCCFNVHYFLGNLNEVDSFDDIWNGEAYRNLRLAMAEGSLPDFCKDCRWFYSKRGHMCKGVKVADMVTL